jgi:dTDP-4-amino-4,6-dideoxygalactose transaminase
MEGGMVTTNDSDVAMLARSYRNQGKRGATFGNDHRDLGNSWRINELGAVIGWIQLAKLDAMLERRQTAASSMAATLDQAGLPYVSTAHMDRAANYKLIVRTDALHDELKPRFAERGVILGGGVYERPCHLQPVFEHVPTPARGLPNAERYCPTHICPPLTSGMSESDVARVNQALQECLAPNGR